MPNRATFVSQKGRFAERSIVAWIQRYSLSHCSCKLAISPRSTWALGIGAARASPTSICGPAASSGTGSFLSRSRRALWFAPDPSSCNQAATNAAPGRSSTPTRSGNSIRFAMDVQSLVAKYLRLRGDLRHVANSSHARRLRDEMQQLESHLMESHLPFADTLPLESPQCLIAANARASTDDEGTR